MAKITIQRIPQRINSMREYEIYVDEQKIITINDGEKKTLDISEGNHKIYIKIDWCKSKVLDITLTDGQELKLKCGSKITGIKQAFILLYLFLPNSWVYLDYLSEGEVILNNKKFKTLDEIKAMGKSKFILKYGIIRWGFPTSIIFSISMLFFNSRIHSVRSFVVNIVINLLAFCLFGGVLFGLTMWQILKNKLNS